jgi:hypothetical protein
MTDLLIYWSVRQGTNVVVTSCLVDLRVLQHRSLGEMHFMTQSFKEVEFPLDAEVTPVVVLYDSALSPFPNLEMQHNEKQSMLS